MEKMAIILKFSNNQCKVEAFFFSLMDVVFCSKWVYLNKLQI